jgi:hypothetical protein
MLKHIPIPTVPSSAVGTPSVATNYSQTPTSRSSRPPPPLLNFSRSQQPLNVSTLTTASNISNGGPSLLQTYSNAHTHQTPLLTHYPADAHAKSLQNGHVPRMFTPLPTFSSSSQQHLLKGFNGNANGNALGNVNASHVSSASTSSSKLINPESNGAREALTSLGLLCLGTNIES